MCRKSKFLDLATAVLSAIAAAPTIAGYIKQLSTWVIQQIQAAEKSRLEMELKKAMNRAKEKKDTSQLDQIFDPRKKP